MPIHDTKLPSKPPTFHFATYVKGRYAGAYKVHQNLGHAKNALSCKASSYYGHPGGVIWQWDEAENVWVELFRWEPGAKEAPWA